MARGDLQIFLDGACGQTRQRVDGSGIDDLPGKIDAGSSKAEFHDRCPQRMRLSLFACVQWSYLDFSWEIAMQNILLTA
jgi:hypothetical protein